jgi:hypothetical protein
MAGQRDRSQSRADVNTFDSAVSLSVGGLPANVNGQFSGSGSIPAGGGSVRLTIQVGSSAALGTYQITVSGVGDPMAGNPLTQIAMFTLIITT